LLYVFVDDLLQHEQPLTFTVYIYHIEELRRICQKIIDLLRKSAMAVLLTIRKINVHALW